MKTRKEKKKFKTLGTKLVHRGKVFHLKVVKKKAPDGRVFRHDIAFHPGSAVIIPVLKGGRFVLLEMLLEMFLFEAF